MAVANGVHTIEHANLIDHSTAAAVAAAGAIIVPTLSTYEAMHELGAALGMPAKNLKKNEVVYEAGLKAFADGGGGGSDPGPRHGPDR